MQKTIFMLDRIDLFDWIGRTVSQDEALYIFRTLSDHYPDAVLALVIDEGQGRVITSPDEIRGWILVDYSPLFQHFV